MKLENTISGLYFEFSVPTLIIYNLRCFIYKAAEDKHKFSMRGK
jgi:hypothetical protein